MGHPLRMRVIRNILLVVVKTKEKCKTHYTGIQDHKLGYLWQLLFSTMEVSCEGLTSYTAPSMEAKSIVICCCLGTYCLQGRKGEKRDGLCIQWCRNKSKLGSSHDSVICERTSPTIIQQSEPNRMYIVLWENHHLINRAPQIHYKREFLAGT